MTQADIDTAIANPDSQNPPAPEWPPSLSKGPAWQEQEAAEDRQPITITVLSDPDDPTSVDATVTWDPRWPDMIDTDQAERMLHLDRNTACRYRDALDTVIRRASRYAGQEG